MLNLNFTSFKNITFDEGKILYDFVLKNKIQSILEIGTHAGYSTIWLAKACEQNQGTVHTVDYQRNLNPDSLAMFKINRVGNVFCKTVNGDFETLKEELKKINEKFDLIVIDECHENISELFTSIKNHYNDHCYVIFHDIMCSSSNYMKTPKFWASIYQIPGFEIKKNEVVTYDEKENKNGFGIVELIKIEKEIKEDIARSINIQKRAEENVINVVEETKIADIEKDFKEEKLTQEKKSRKTKKNDT